MINRSYRHSRDLLLVQLNQQILKKDSALQRVFRVVNQEGENWTLLFAMEVANNANRDILSIRRE